jgi:putative nucleotidyltransferase with HDIG domain
MTAGALLVVLERSRPRAYAHSWRVAELAARLGAELGLDQCRLATLHLGALFHDVGKLKLATEILAKPSALTSTERACVQRHAELGVELAYDARLAPAVVQLIKQHHERLDGSGYPCGLGGDQLNLEVRILAVCDVYDALAADRPYAPAWPQEQALAYLRRNAGRLFDPKCVDALQHVLELAAPIASAA